MIVRQQTVLLLQIGQEVLACLKERELTLLTNDRLASKPQLGIDHLRQTPPVLIRVEVHTESKPPFQLPRIIQIHFKKALSS